MKIVGERKGYPVGVRHSICFCISAHAYVRTYMNKASGQLPQCHTTCPVYASGRLQKPLPLFSITFLCFAGSTFREAALCIQAASSLVSTQTVCLCLHQGLCSPHQVTVDPVGMICTPYPQQPQNFPTESCQQFAQGIQNHCRFYCKALRTYQMGIGSAIGKLSLTVRHPLLNHSVHVIPGYVGSATAVGLVLQCIGGVCCTFCRHHLMYACMLEWCNLQTVTHTSKCMSYF